MTLRSVDSFRSQSSCTSNESEFSLLDFEKRTETNSITSPTCATPSPQVPYYMSRKHLEWQLFGDDNDVQTVSSEIGDVENSTFRSINADQNLKSDTSSVSYNKYEIKIDSSIFASFPIAEVYSRHADEHYKTSFPPHLTGFPPRPDSNAAQQNARISSPVISYSIPQLKADDAALTPPGEDAMTAAEPKVKGPHFFYFAGQHFVQKGYIPYPIVREPPPFICPDINSQDYRLVYMVTFKTNTKDYMLGPECAPTVSVGDAVIVAADKGEDMGVVSRIVRMREFLYERFQSVYLPPTFNISRYVGTIVKLASVRERRKMRAKVVEEKDVLAYAQHIASNKYRLNIAVVDVEFQYDRYKLIVYYRALQGHVEYRDFTNDLYHAFKSRIWMERV